MLQPSPHKPEGFRSAGTVLSARRSTLARRKPTGKIAKKYKIGLQYEKKAIRFLEKELRSAGDFYCEPCFHFHNHSSDRLCYPDALLVSESLVLIIEIKTRHTTDAWFQLRKLYYPVVSKVYEQPIKLLEVCRAYDPLIELPEKETILENLEDYARADTDYCTYIYNGR